MAMTRNNAAKVTRIRQPARKNGNASMIDSAKASEAIVQFAGDRANELADWLHQRLKDEIASAQTSLSEVHIGQSVAGVRDFIIAGARYARQHPWRVGMLAALFGTAMMMAYPQGTEVVAEQ